MKSSNINSIGKNITFIFLISLCISDIDAQKWLPDTLYTPTENKLHFYQVAFPTLMIGYGVAALESPTLQNFNRTVQNGLVGNSPIRIDDYLIYAPITVDLGLTLSGYQSKHSYIEKMGLYFCATAMNAMFVYPTKVATNEERPDKTDFKSFPSGHTSNAFVGAEFFWQEYKHKSTWVALSGYLGAATTGFLRIHNNKHWFNDVVAGAGIGILSTKLTYWLYPKCYKALKLSSNKVVVVPMTNGDLYGIGLVYSLD